MCRAEKPPNERSLDVNARPPRYSRTPKRVRLGSRWSKYWIGVAVIAIRPIALAVRRLPATASEINRPNAIISMPTTAIQRRLRSCARISLAGASHRAGFDRKEKDDGMRQ